MPHKRKRVTGAGDRQHVRCRRHLLVDGRLPLESCSDMRRFSSARNAPRAAVVSPTAGLASRPRRSRPRHRGQGTIGAHTPPLHAYMRRDQAHGGRGGRLRRRGIGVRRRGRGGMTVPLGLCRPGPPSLSRGAQCTRSTFLARATVFGGLSAGRQQRKQPVARLRNEPPPVFD